MKFKTVAVASVAAVMLFVGACSMQKKPATEAATAAEAALAAIKDDAAKYLPNDLQGAEASLAALKDNLTKGEFKQVLADAPALMSSLDSLKTNVAAKIEEAKAATAEWETLAGSLPGLVGSIEARIGELSKAKKLPKGITKAALADATTASATVKSEWDAASADFSAGNPVGAVAKAKEVKTKAEALAAAMGVTAG